jgi:hypothetical protein
MAIEPWKLLFRHNEQVSSLELGPHIYSNTYFPKNLDGANIPTKRQIVHLGRLTPHCD